MRGDDGNADGDGGDGDPGRPWRRAAAAAAAIVAVAALLGLLAPRLPPLRSLALALDDLYQALLAPAAGGQHPGIALVTVGEDSLAATAACRSPIDRLFLADLIRRLDDAGVRAIGLDVLLDQATTPAADEALGAALRSARAPVVAITALANTAMSADQRLWHDAYLRGLPQGSANLAKDRIDGVVRRWRPLDRDGGLAFPAALAAALGDPPPPRGALEVAWRPPPADPAAAGETPFAAYGAELVPHLPPDWLAGRVVLIGTMLEGTDRHRTPLSLAGRGDMPGVEIQAHMLAQLLDGTRLPRPPRWLALVLPPLAATGGLAVAASGLGLAAQVAVAATAAPLALALAAAAFALGGPLAGPLPPALAWLAAQGLATLAQARRERADRQVLMRLFAHHLSAPIAAEVWARRDTFLAGGRPRPQRLTATVLFSDIEGFTTVTEALAPEALMRWLEAYLDRMVGIVDEHGGVVLRFIGDAVFAAFGVPVPRATEAEVAADAARAAACARAMALALPALNAELAAQGLPPVGIRIGLQTGPMIAGSLGRSEHLEYALMGDAVNTAARLEALGKTLRRPGADPGCTILIGGATRERLGGGARVRPVGEVGLKGKETKVEVFELAMDQDKEVVAPMAAVASSPW